MSETFPIEAHMFSDDLLKAYKLTDFHIELLKFLPSTSCDHAIATWKSTWEFCPVCGGREDKDGLILHRSKREYA